MTDDEAQSMMVQLCAQGMAKSKDGGKTFSLTPCGTAYVEAMPFTPDQREETAAIWALAWASAAAHFNKRKTP